MAKRHRKFMIQTDVKHPETGEKILSEEDILAVLQEKNLKRWAYVLHDSDVTENEDGEEEKRAPHWHVCIWVNSATTHSAVAKWFGVAENFVEHEKSSWEAMLTYLTHELELDKYRYPDDKIKASPGYDWTEDRDMYVKRRAERMTKDELDDLFRQCADGTIREYDHHLHIPPLVYIKNEKVFKQAFAYFLENVAWKMLKPKRIMFIAGISGSGKTKLAQELAARVGERPFVSSGGSDVMDGYKGERYVIFDDFRGQDWNVEQLLKLTDPYTPSKTWSRFKSKSMAAADTIVFTFPSSKEMEKVESVIYTPPEMKEFFETFKGSENEPIKQWYRRVELFTRVVNREIDDKTGVRTSYFYAKINPDDHREGWGLIADEENVYERVVEQLDTKSWLTGMGINVKSSYKLEKDWRDKVTAGVEDDEDDGLPF